MTVHAITGLLISIISAFVGIMGYKRIVKKDIEEASATSATILSEIKHVRTGVDEIKAEQKETRLCTQEMAVRLAKVEDKASSAHKRIDDINAVLRGNGKK